MFKEYEKVVWPGFCSHQYKFDRYVHFDAHYANTKAVVFKGSIYKCVKCLYEDTRGIKPVEDLND